MRTVESQGKVIGISGSPKDFNEAFNEQLLLSQSKRTRRGHKRYRATVVVLQDNKILLVRDRGQHDFSLPGGGFKKGESTIQAGAREIYEELGLKTVSAQRLRYCDLEGRRAKHKVCSLEVKGKPHPKGRELDKFVWWDMEQELPTQGHVKYIVERLGR